MSRRRLNELRARQHEAPIAHLLDEAERLMGLLNREDRYYDAAALGTLNNAIRENLDAAAERLMFAKLDPYLRTGRKVRKASERGNQERGEQSRREAKERWQPRCNELIAKNARLSWNRVCQTVARQFGVSRATIDRHCTDPRKTPKK